MIKITINDTHKHGTDSISICDGEIEILFVGNDAYGTSVLEYAVYLSKRQPSPAKKAQYIKLLLRILGEK